MQRSLWRCGILLLLFVTTLQSHTEAQLTTTINLFYQEGIISFWKRDWSGVVESMSNVLNVTESADAYAHRANGHRLLNNMRDANADIQRALELDSNSVTVMAIQSRFEELVDLSAGIRIAQRAVQLDNTSALANYYLAALYSLNSEHRNAINTYTNGLSLSVDIPEAEDYYLAAVYYWRARSYMDINDVEQAVADGERAVELSGDIAIYLTDLSWMYNEDEQYSSALAMASRAIELDTEGWYGYSQRAFAYMKTNRCTNAIADFTQAIRLSDTPSTYDYANRGWCRWQLNDREALLDFAQARIIDPTHEYAQTTGVEILRQDYMLTLSDFNNTSWTASDRNGETPKDENGVYIMEGCYNVEMPALFSASHGFSFSLDNRDDYYDVLHIALYFDTEQSAQAYFAEFINMLDECRGSNSTFINGLDVIGDESYYMRTNTGGFIAFAGYHRVENVLTVVATIFPNQYSDLDDSSSMLALSGTVVARAYTAPTLGGLK